MKAIVWTKYGPPDVLEVKDIAKPIAKDNDVLIKVRAASVTTGDCEMRMLSGARWYTLLLRAYIGLRKPERVTILGMELAGEVEAVGKDVSLFKAGDAVFATTGVGCGAYADYISLPERSVGVSMAIKPANMTYEEAATVPMAGYEALYFMRQAKIQNGHKVLIIGAGGTIGTFAVQLARYFGAEVTAVDSTGKLDLLRSLGADKVIDYMREDFAESGETYDVIFDVVGKSSFSQSMRSIKQHGRYVLANPRLSQMIQGRWISMMSSKKVIFGAARQQTDDLTFLKRLIEAGKLRSVIDKCYPLEQTVEAHRYVETGQKKGHVVISMAT